uniref:Uncharacterized protein n=1 Tax=Solanum lycopersicum TaxID=4081 RepID=K4D7N3_SOLLC
MAINDKFELIPISMTKKNTLDLQHEILNDRLSLERNRQKPEHKLLDWIKYYPADGKKFGMLMYPRLENRHSISAIRKMAKLVDTCLLKSSKDRQDESGSTKSKEDHSDFHH